MSVAGLLGDVQSNNTRWPRSRLREKYSVQYSIENSLLLF